MPQFEVCVMFRGSYYTVVEAEDERKAEDLAVMDMPENPYWEVDMVEVERIEEDEG